MTEEIKRKIADAVIQYAENNSPKQLVIPVYHDAAHFGYSLASEQLTAAEARIKELEEGLRAVHGGIGDETVYEYIHQLLNK